jgi:rhamnosyltransferase
VKLTSITVAFNPDPFRLAMQIAALHGQVDEIIIVDNGSVPPVQSTLAHSKISILFGTKPPITFIVLKENGGVASGFNVGIAASRNSGAEFVLLLDQDSLPAEGMTAKLLAGFVKANAASAASGVAAVGPRVVDSRDAQEYPFIQLGWFRNRHLRCADSQEKFIDCDILISSGTLLSIEAFDKIGKFDEKLFIDNVDLEWCCRARKAHFSLAGACEAELNHRLGDHRHLIFNRVNMVVHSPSRVYYQTRNRLLLYRRGYIPLKWKLKDVLRMTARFVAIMLFVAPRMEYLQMTLRAVIDGIANRGGHLQDDR